jgi:hypothetical protein
VEARCGSIHNWRNLQSQGPDSQGEFVRQFQRSLVTMEAAAGGGKRRQQDVEACDTSQLSRLLSEINAECCDEPSEDCSGGKIKSCNKGCAAVLLPVWDSCQSDLDGATAQILRMAAQKCPRTGSAAGAHAVQQFALTCPAGVTSMDCIPACAMTCYGDELLLSLDGDDTKMSCEMRNGLLSWIALNGGFLGPDALTFSSSLNSGAAGTVGARPGRLRGT